jgi:hypothetical protein
MLRCRKQSTFSAPTPPRRVLSTRGGVSSVPDGSALSGDRELILLDNTVCFPGNCHHPRKRGDDN